MTLQIMFRTIVTRQIRTQLYSNARMLPEEQPQTRNICLSSSCQWSTARDFTWKSGQGSKFVWKTDRILESLQTNWMDWWKLLTVENWGKALCRNRKGWSSCWNKRNERTKVTRGTRKPGRRGKKQRKIRLTTALRIRSPHSTTRWISVNGKSQKTVYPRVRERKRG